MTHSGEQVDYAPYWRGYWGRWLSLGLFLLLMVGFTLAQPSLPPGYRRMFNTPAFVDVFGAVWLIGGQALNLRLLTFCCPRCGGYFMMNTQKRPLTLRSVWTPQREIRGRRTSGRRDVPEFPAYLTARCVHCGLPRNARDGSGAA